MCVLSWRFWREVFFGVLLRRGRWSGDKDQIFKDLISVGYRYVVLGGKGDEVLVLLGFRGVYQLGEVGILYSKQAGLVLKFFREEVFFIKGGGKEIGRRGEEGGDGVKG